MRRLVALSLVPLLAAAPLSAQFEGVLQAHSTSGGGRPADVTYYLKGARAAFTMPNTLGGGGEMRGIIDNGAQRITILMPMMPQMAALPGMADAKGMSITIDMAEAAKAIEKNGVPTWKDLGTTETIAGHTCKDMDLVSGKDVTHLCMATDLGRFALSFGGRGGSKGNWINELGDRGFPLKVVSDGASQWEVTSIQKQAVPASMFAIPEGYKDMTAMMGGMMGGRRGGPQ